MVHLATLRGLKPTPAQLVEIDGAAAACLAAREDEDRQRQRELTQDELAPLGALLRARLGRVYHLRRKVFHQRALLLAAILYSVFQLAQHFDERTAAAVFLVGAVVVGLLPQVLDQAVGVEP